MFETLKQFDADLFTRINSRHNSFWDVIMYWASHDFFWVWLYAIFLGMVWVVYKKRTILVLPVVALLILCSDQSANIVKNSVKRYRPCYNAEILKNTDVHLNLPVDEHGQFKMPGKHGFVSSHASNTFALAFFLSMLLMKRFRYFPLLIFSWAALVSYSRVYNGVHYPADVAGGAMLGLFCAFAAWKLWQYLEARFMQKHVS